MLINYNIKQNIILLIQHVYASNYTGNSYKTKEDAKFSYTGNRGGSISTFPMSISYRRRRRVCERYAQAVGLFARLLIHIILQNKTHKKFTSVSGSLYLCLKMMYNVLMLRLLEFLPYFKKKYVSIMCSPVKSCRRVTGATAFINSGVH